MTVDRRRRTADRAFLVLSIMTWMLFTGPPGDAQTQPTGVESSVVTGATISLDLKGVDILDVLKLLSQKSGLNFVAGRNVTGRVTIFAKEVDIWEAFERIIAANELAYERQGQIVNVMTTRDYEQLYGEKFQEYKEQIVLPLRYASATQLATVLNQLKSSLGRVVVDEASNTLIINDVPTPLEEMRQLILQLDRPTETRIYTLNNAEAEKLQEKVQEFLTPAVGSVSVDARTNKVVVTDLRAAMPRLDQLIHALDEQEGQVLIEAKIVRVELNDEQDLGVDWQQALAGVDTQLRGNFRVLSDIVGGTTTGAALKLLSAPKANTQVIVEALKKFGKVDTVSNPRIMVSNNQEAKILIGTKEAFVTTTTTLPTASGSVINAPQVQFVDVGTKLYVTPSIKRDGHIKLKIRPEVSSVSKTITDIANTRIPILSTTEAETNVMVNSGTTLIIGGLIDTRVEHNQNQIPLLGDIPLLGAAFRSRVDINKKSELVVFLTPQIISANGERQMTFPSAPSIESVGTSDEQGAAQLPASYSAMIRGLARWYLAKELARSDVPAGSLTVSFALGPDGRLVGEPQIASPQGDRFVEAARAALAGGVFPSFPEGSTSANVRFHVAVEYQP